jgi:5'-nucleotidase
MKSRPHILITNDDGIHAPGIKHLWKALNPVADLTIVAPAVEQSAVSLGITVRHPIRLERSDQFGDTPAWCITGTPTDCVKMALSVILNNPPDLIVSGINCGSNAGRNLLYSGTVAGVIEGILRDIPGIAFSCYEEKNPEFALTEKYIPLILQEVLKHPLPSGTLLNVNFPFPMSKGIKGFKMTRQGKECMVENPDKRIHPVKEHEYYWLGAKLWTPEEDAETDTSWLRLGYITAVPVHIAELTDHRHLQQRKQHFEDALNLYLL